MSSPHDDTTFMLRALELARLGQGLVEPNPMVGSVIVREGQIVGMLMRGATNKQIAADLRIGEKTVKNYMTILMQKLHARNRLEVLIAAQKLEVDDHQDREPMLRH